jgi:hypothetical protein
MPVVDAEMLKAVIGALWPLTILFIVFFFAHPLKQLASAFISRFESDVSIKIGSIEFEATRIKSNQPSQGKGADVYVASSDVELRRATEGDFMRRKSYRYESRFVRLVHTIFPTGDSHFPQKALVYLKIEKILPQLDQDAGYKPARLNDIDYVEYYLGKYYGKGDWGSWFILRDCQNGFAIEYPVEDEIYCIAKVHFHGGVEIELQRYLDVEVGKGIAELEKQINDLQKKSLAPAIGSDAKKN